MEDISVLINDVKFNFRVGVIFEFNGKVIIEKGGKGGHGVLPGGRVKTLENTKEALIREIKEEMHFDISKKEIKLQSIIENFFENSNQKFHELYFVYKIQLDDNDDIVKIESQDFINYDSESNYYEFVDINNIDDEFIKPLVIKKIVKEENFKNFVVRD